MSHFTPPRPSAPQEVDAPRAIVAGVLATGVAAALGAVVTSYGGIQDTIVGAMLSAMVVAALSQVVRVPLDRMERQLYRWGFGVRRSRLRSAPRLRIQARPLKVTYPPARRQIRPGRTAVVGAAGFIVGMLLLSGFELTAGRPVSAATTNNQRTGTTLGNLVKAQPSPDAAAAIGTGTPTQTPAITPTVTPGILGANQAATTPTTIRTPTPSPAATSNARPTLTATAAPTAPPTPTFRPSATPAERPDATPTRPPGSMTPTATPERRS